MRVGVVGVGHLGQHHARILEAMEGVTLVGVADTNRGRADEIAARHGTKPFADAAELIELVDAVTIAVPTVSHLEAAAPFLERRKAVLVEKPIAASVAEADRLIALAERRGIVMPRAARRETEPPSRPRYDIAYPIEAAGRLIGVPVLRQFGLVENEKVDSFLAAVFSKSPAPADQASNATKQRRIQRREKTRARQMRN